MSDQEAEVELFDLQIVEGSFVDKGDNPEAHISFFKRADDAGMSEKMMHDDEDKMGHPDERKMGHPDERKMGHPDERKMGHPDEDKGYEYKEEYSSPRSTMEFMHETKMTDLKQSMMQSVYEILSHAKPEQWTSMLNQSVGELKSVLDEMGHTINKDSDTAVVVDGATEEKMTEKSETVFDDVIATLNDEQRAAVEAKIEEAQKAAEEVVAEKSAEANDVAKRLESLEKRAETAEAEVAKMRDEKLTAEFQKRATEIGCGDIEKMTVLLKNAYGRSEEEGADLEAQFRAMAAQAKVGQNNLFKSVGTTAGGTEDASPDALIESAAKRIMEADAKVGYRDAYKMALSQNREAYSRMINTRGIAE